MIKCKHFWTYPKETPKSAARGAQMKYWVQRKDLAGNWYDYRGTENLDSAKARAKWSRKAGYKTRVVERTDIVVGDEGEN